MLTGRSTTNRSVRARVLTAVSRRRTDCSPAIVSRVVARLRLPGPECPTISQPAEPSRQARLTLTTTPSQTVAGQPRTPADAAAFARYERAARIPIILAALLPLILVPSQGHWVSIVLDVVSWLVFLVDFVIHRRRLHHYLATRLGQFDLVVVLLTAPWFLIAGVHSGSIVVVLRLARVARLLMASRGAKRLFERLGRVAIVASAVLVLGALVAYYAEHPANPGFQTYRDSLWWAFVTLTTVGYGDIVPKTPTGRWVAVIIMLTGVGVLGLLAGSLASFFRVDSPDRDDSAPHDASGDGGALPTGSATDADRIMAELAALRAEVALLSDQLSTMSGAGRSGDSDDPAR